MQRLLGNSFRFYRLYYSVFATVYLVPLLYLQFTIESVRVWERQVFSESAGVLMVIAGLTVMFICIRKYFFDLSGVKVLVKGSHSPNQLQTDGLHTIVRHPLYFGTLLFIWGCSFLFPLLSNLIACSLISIYTIAGIQMEERKLIAEFGEQYKVYARKVPMLIPRISIRTGKAERRLSELIRSWIY